MLICGCTYCNYNETEKMCKGVCNSDLGVCLNKISKPSKDSDCICAKCETNVDSQGNMTCSGTCYESGFSCKVQQIPAYTPTGYANQCICS